MAMFNKNKEPRRKPTKGFSELNRRTYEASPSARSLRQPRQDFAGGYRPPAQVRENINDYSRGTTGRKYAQAHKKNANKKKIKIIIAIIVAVLAILIAAGIAFAININNNLHEGMDDIGLTPTSLNKPFYALLMGVDASDERKGASGTDNDFRSDSIILTRVDPIDKKVTMMSLHRDVEVDFGGEYGVQKLNAAHSIGGPEACIKAVKQLTGIDVNHYAEANFEGFAKAVDDLGGVEVDVPIDVNDVEAGGSLTKGKQTLNGSQCLILCRTRHSFDDVGDGDKYRAANQRMVLSAIAKKALDADVATIANTVNDLSKYIKTDLGLNDIIGLCQNMKDIDFEKDVYSAMMPTNGVYKNGGWYEEIEQPKFSIMLKRMEEGKPPSVETIIDPSTGVVLAYSGAGDGSGRVSVKNGTNTEGLAAKAAEKLASSGFGAEAGNADNADYKKTIIVYNNDNQRENAEKIRDALGCGEVIKNNNNEYNITGDFLVVLGADFSG